jgi:hypothetical protein
MEGLTLRAFEKAVSRRVRGRTSGSWRKLYSEEDRTSFSSQHIISVIKSRRIGLVELIAHMGDIRNSYKILVGKTKGKNPLGRPRHEWGDNMVTHNK